MCGCLLNYDCAHSMVQGRDRSRIPPGKARVISPALQRDTGATAAPLAPQVKRELGKECHSSLTAPYVMSLTAPCGIGTKEPQFGQGAAETTT
jgi:hypothetical protein